MRGGTPLRLLFYWVVGVGLTTVIAHGVGDATIDPSATGSEASRAPPDATPFAGPTQPLVQVGVASWYGLDHQGKLTASGRPFDRRKLTAAHPSLPLNSKAKVTNLENGKSVEVTINDRGPGAPGRAIDVSERAAQTLGMKKEGLAPVVIEPVGGRNSETASR
jgi:rare lipoprotein A (peptidoglycan hydrolase)